MFSKSFLYTCRCVKISMLVLSIGLFDLIIQLLQKLITFYIKSLLSLGHQRQLGRKIMFCCSFDDKDQRSK